MIKKNLSFFLITSTFTVLISCSPEKEDPSVLQTSNETVAVDYSNLGYYSLDSLEAIGYRGRINKTYFFHDLDQNLDTLRTDYVYSEEEDKFLFKGATITNGKDVNKFLNLPLQNISLNKNDQINLTVHDTSSGVNHKYGWIIKPGDSQWTKSRRNMKKIFKNNLVQEIIFYQEDGSYHSNIYKYKDTLLIELNSYTVSDSDSSITRKEIFVHNKNDQLLEHSKMGYNEKEKRMITFSKKLNTYNNKGLLTNYKYLEFSSEEKNGLRVTSEHSYRYNKKGLVEYREAFSEFERADYNITYEYDDAGNCIFHHINRFNQGYRYGKKVFKYDKQNRLIEYILLNKTSENEKFDITEIKTFEYFKETRFLKKQKSGRSYTNLKIKKDLTYDKYGNVTKSISESKNLYIELIYDYNIPLETVHSYVYHFNQNRQTPEVNLYGLKMRSFETKISHAIKSQTTYKLKDKEYSVYKNNNFYYSEKE